MLLVIVRCLRRAAHWTGQPGLFNSGAVRQATALVHTALPNSRIAILRGQQHIDYRTAPELFVQTMLGFLLE